MEDIILNKCHNAYQGMAALWVNTIDHPVASSEKPEYPVDNILDNHPKKIWWSANPGISTVSFDIKKGTNCLTIFGTNASRISIKFYNPNAVRWEDTVAWEDTVRWDSDEFVTAFVFDLVQNGNTYAVWIDFKTLPIDLRAEISFVAPDNVPVYVGVILAGFRHDVEVNPLQGLQESLVSYSLKTQLTNGAWWGKKRDVVRNFNGTLSLDRDPAFYHFMYGIAREVDPFPAAWKVVDTNLRNWIVYGLLQDMPTGTHSFKRSEINFNILEVI